MGKDSSEIRREIEQTRARMGDTVEALGYKADVPSRVKEAVNDRVETVKGTISDVVDSVKDTVAGATDALGGALGGASGKVGNALGGAKRSVSDTLGDTTDKVGNVTGKLGDATSRLGDVRSSVANTVSNTVGSVSDKLPNPEAVKDAARRGVGIAAENPLGLALGALAVGFLAGLTAPVTDLERETVGPIRDDLVERAKSVGTDALEHGKQVLQETAQAALGAAQSSVQQHGGQVLSEAKGDSMHGQSQNGNENRSGESASAAGMPSDTSQGGGLRGETLASGGTGSQTSSDTGKTSSQYGVLLDEEQDTLEPGKPGTASP